jgi:hypothetical protein
MRPKEMEDQSKIDWASGAAGRYSAR